MEQLTDSPITPCFTSARKKRSDSRRRPRSDPRPVTQHQDAFTLAMSPADIGTCGDTNLYSSNVRSRMGPDPQSCNVLFADNIKSDRNNKEVLSDQVLEPERLGDKKKLKKLKLKLGGVTRTLHTKSSREIAVGLLSVRSSDASGAHKKQSQASSLNYNYQYDLVQKSKRVAKIHGFDDEFDEDDEEIRYLKKLRASKLASGGDRKEDNTQKTKGIAKLMSSKHNDVRDNRKDGRKKPSLYEDNDYEMDIPSDDGLKGVPAASGQEMTMTTRKRALEGPESGGAVEFPNGLPDAPSKKQKLSEVDHKLRKAEIAQRRKLQAERAAKEAEAEAIRKILGQDSSRKKKEDKLKKRQEELAQEKNDKAAALRPNTIRLSMGPKGTVVSFSEDVGLPKIFNSLPCRYPPPREKCVGPDCTNEYKYRDSKSKLPLCSIHCYKAVQGNTGLLPAC